MRPTLRPAILGFLLTLTIMVGLLTTQFLLKYGTDIFGNNIGAFAILKILLLFILSATEFALPISVLVMTTIHYRNLFKQKHPEFKIKSTLLIASILATVCFIWTAFLLPVVHLHEGSLLYDIKAKEINLPMGRTNPELFKGLLITSNYSEISGIIDSTYKSALNKKTEFLENVKTNQMAGVNLKKYQEAVNYDLKQNNSLINTMRIKKAQMLSFAFLVFILFYSGMFLGILNINNRLLLILISIYLTVLPGIYYLSIYFEKLAKERSITPFQSQIYFISTILLITLGLYFYARRHLRVERTSGGNIT